MLKWTIFLLWVSSVDCFVESFDEKLVLTPRGNSHLQADFRFLLERNYTSKDETEYVVFPRIIQEMIDTYSIKYMIITMGLGRWKDKWAAPPVPSSTAGAQLYVEFQADSDKDADTKLQFLVEALNGILCTSISKMGAFTSPNLPIFSRSEGSKNHSLYSRYGIVSDQPTCTENLTRLRKLLACRETGLSALLHPSRLYDVPFHSSHIVIENNFVSEKERKFETKLEIGVSVVMKLINNKRPVWMISDIFDRKLSQKCAASRKSQIDIVSRGKTTTHELKENVDFEDIVVKIESESIEKNKIDDNLIKIWSSQGGFDQHGGTLLISLQSIQSSNVQAIISQIIPSHVGIRYSKITTKCFNKDGGQIPAHILDKKFISKTDPSDSSALLQLKIDVEPDMFCEVTIPFLKLLLKLDQYPPDANHGLHIPAAVVYVKSTDSRNQTLHSNAILVTSPVPDFSMPFNVICFVATTFSLVCGPIQLYSTMFVAPALHVPGKGLGKRINQAILLLLIVLCLYAHFMEVNLNEVRRSIGTYFEKLNDMK